MSGESVGYTNVGKVFMHIPHQSNQGEPLQTTVMWEPQVAREIGGFLIEAAEAADAMKAKVEAGNGNDSAATDRGGT